MLRNALWLGLGLRLLVAVWNGFFGPSFGAQMDAHGLHVLATDIANGIYPEEFRIGLLYIYVLGAIYRLTTPSLFLGSVLSCLVWLMSALTLAAAFRVIGVGRAAQGRAMIIYGVLPSSVLWTAVTLREPYQLLCVNLAVYASLKILVDRSRQLWLLLVATVAVGTVLHGALLGWGVCLVAAVLVLQVVHSRRPFTRARFAVAIIGALVVALVGYWVFTTLFSYPVDQGLAFAVNSYQRGGLSIGVRTDYRTFAEVTTALDLLMFMPTALLQYLFEPMPWRITALADLVVVMENLVRAGLIGLAAIAMVKLPSRSRGPALLVVFSYVLLETAWAVGTFNWGTAARHHIPSFGLLLLAAFAYPSRPFDTGSHNS